jgi:hypothetical protein
MLISCNSVSGKTFISTQLGKFMVTESDVNARSYVLYRWSIKKNDYQMIGYFTGKCASIEGDVLCYINNNITKEKMDEWHNEVISQVIDDDLENISSMTGEQISNRLNKTEPVEETDMSEHQLDDYYFPENCDIELVEDDAENETEQVCAGTIDTDKSQKVYNVLFSKHYKSYGWSITRVVSFTTKQKSLDYINSVVDAWEMIGHTVECKNDVWKVKSDSEYKIELRESKVY